MPATLHGGYFKIHKQLRITKCSRVQSASIMLQRHSLKAICSSPFRGQLEFLQRSRTYSSRARSESEDADLEAARAWFRNFNQSTIPTKIAKTQYSRSGGSGGQHANKYVYEWNVILVRILLMFSKHRLESDNRLGCRFPHSLYSKGSSPRTARQ
jgi:hypothetical protein